MALQWGYLALVGDPRVCRAHHAFVCDMFFFFYIFFLAFFFAFFFAGAWWVGGAGCAGEKGVCLMLGVGVGCAGETGGC